MQGLPADTWLRLGAWLGAWLALGLVLSAGYGRRAARRHRLATPGSVQAPAP